MKKSKEDLEEEFIDSEFYKIKIDNSLENYKDAPIFKDKLDKANETLERIGVPTTWEKSETDEITDDFLKIFKLKSSEKNNIKCKCQECGCKTKDKDEK